MSHYRRSSPSVKWGAASRGNAISRILRKCHPFFQKRIIFPVSPRGPRVHVHKLIWLHFVCLETNIPEIFIQLKFYWALTPTSAKAFSGVRRSAVDSDSAHLWHVKENVLEFDSDSGDKGLNKGPASFLLGNLGVKRVASLHPYFLICKMWERLAPPVPGCSW